MSSRVHPLVPEHRPDSDACEFVAGEAAREAWSDVQADAWIGLLETHKRLTRALEAELEAEHGLSLSSVELLGRLAAAHGRRLRLSALAAEAGLSLSRVSRLVDGLESRQLVRREACPSDARAVEAHLTGAGLELARRAQATHVASVRARFFEHLEPGDAERLAEIFARFAPEAAAQCSAAEPAETSSAR